MAFGAGHAFGHIAVCPALLSTSRGNPLRLIHLEDGTLPVSAPRGDPVLGSGLPLLAPTMPYLR